MAFFRNTSYPRLLTYSPSTAPYLPLCITTLHDPLSERSGSFCEDARLGFVKVIRSCRREKSTKVDVASLEGQRQAQREQCNRHEGLDSAEGDGRSCIIEGRRNGGGVRGRAEGVLQRPCDQEWSDSESRDTVWLEGRQKTGEMGPSSDARRWSTWRECETS